MSLEDYKVDGVTYTPVNNPNGDCKGCIAIDNSDLCNELSPNCAFKIWTIKEEDKLQDYIQKIEEKYPEEEQEPKKYNHYFKDVSNLKYVDIYRVLDLWDVTHPCLQHAAKKILVAGNRGHKDVAKDVQEAIDSLERWKQMQEENKGFNDKQ